MMVTRNADFNNAITYASADGCVGEVKVGTHGSCERISFIIYNSCTKMQSKMTGLFLASVAKRLPGTVL